MEEVLKYKGFSVKTSNSADNVAALIDTFNPDFLLIDYILEGINGGETCHQVKIKPETSRLPVIIVSAYPKVLLSLGDYGCDQFISKPFDLEDLIGSIKSVLSSSLKSTKPTIY